MYIYDTQPCKFIHERMSQLRHRRYLIIVVASLYLLPGHVSGRSSFLHSQSQVLLHVCYIQVWDLMIISTSTLIVDIVSKAYDITVF